MTEEVFAYYELHFSSKYYHDRPNEVGIGLYDPSEGDWYIPGFTNKIRTRESKYKNDEVWVVKSKPLNLQMPKEL